MTRIFFVHAKNWSMSHFNNHLAENVKLTLIVIAFYAAIIALTALAW